MGLLALWLAGYLWLAKRSPKLALLVYALILLLLLPPASTIFGDLLAARSGLITFGKGYTLWHDVLLGEIAFWSPLVLYHILCRLLGVPPVRRALEPPATAQGEP